MSGGIFDINFHVEDENYVDGMNSLKQCFFCQGHNTKRRYEVECHMFIGENMFKKTLISCCECWYRVDDEIVDKSTDCQTCLDLFE